MRVCAFGLSLAMLLAFAAGCHRFGGPPPGARAPSRELAERAVRTLLPGLRFGADEVNDTYREIRALRVAGSHYIPAMNRHVVHYCVDYTSFAGDTLRTRCDLNVQLYQLDSEEWVGYASGVGTLYRWQVLETRANAAETTPGAAPGPEKSTVAPGGE